MSYRFEAFFRQRSVKKQRILSSNASTNVVTRSCFWNQIDWHHRKKPGNLGVLEKANVLTLLRILPQFLGTNRLESFALTHLDEHDNLPAAAPLAHTSLIVFRFTPSNYLLSIPF